MAVEVAAGEGLAPRRASWARRAARSRDARLGACLLALAFGGAFAVREATGAHIGSAVKATFVGPVVQAPANVVTTNQIPAAPSLELPKVVKLPARHVASPHRAAVHVTTVAAVTAPVTPSSSPPPTSTGGTSGSPSVSPGPTSSSNGSAGAPSTSQGTQPGTSSSGSGAGGGTSSGTSSGGTSSGTSSGGGSSSSNGTVSGGG